MSAARSFRAVIAAGPGKSFVIAVPFDPDSMWGSKPRHLMHGHVGPCRVRGSVDRVDDRHGLRLGPAWVRDSGLRVGDEVDVTLAPEGPQRGGLDADIAAALAAEPSAAEFFDGLAQFYRKGYLTWIAATRKKPEERARRIAETVTLLKAGVKQRPP